MVTKHWLLYRSFENSISDYDSQDDNANPEVGASTLWVPWVTEVIAVGHLNSLRSSISIAKISARVVYRWVTTCTLPPTLPQIDIIILHPLNYLLKVVEEIKDACCVNDYHEHLAGARAHDKIFKHVYHVIKRA